MKKFLVTFAIMLGVFFANTAEATNYYAYSDNGTDYYITSTRKDQANALYVWLSGSRNGKVVAVLKYAYFKKNGAEYFYLWNESNGKKLAEGYVSSNGAASNVREIISSGKFDAAVQKDISALREAEKQKAAALKEQEAKAEPLLEKAFECYKKGQYSKTMEFQKQAVAVAPDYVPSYVELAYMYERTKQPQQGINLITNAIVNRKLRDSRLFFARGQIYERMGNLSEAGRDYTAALNENPDSDLKYNIKQAQQRMWRRSI